jgi:hypothetical protein
LCINDFLTLGVGTMGVALLYVVPNGIATLHVGTKCVLSLGVKTKGVVIMSRTAGRRCGWRRCAGAVSFGFSMLNFV